jgi:hypothetical protein
MVIIIGVKEAKASESEKTKHCRSVLKMPIDNMEANMAALVFMPH